MRHLKTALTVIGAVAVLVLAANTVALAATGNALILGKTNSAHQQTVVKRTTIGPPVRLVAKNPGAAPFTTNARGRIVNLNADKVDGLDSTALRTRSYMFTATYTDAQTVSVVLPVPAGNYLVSYSAPADNLNLNGGNECFIRQGTQSTATLITGRSSFQHQVGDMIAAHSGSGAVTKTASNQISVYCGSENDGFSASAPSPMQIVVTPTTVISRKTLTPSTTAVP